jgi:hypothetical protein
MLSFDVEQVHGVDFRYDVKWFSLTWLWRGCVIPRSAAARSPLIFAVQTLRLHRLASSDESSMLEHLLRFFRAFFSSVLLENVDECLVCCWIG